MNFLSDRVLRYTAWVLFALAVCTLVSVIYIPVKALVIDDTTADGKAKPVRNENPVQQNYKCNKVMQINEQVNSGEV